MSLSIPAVAQRRRRRSTSPNLPPNTPRELEGQPIEGNWNPITLETT